MGNIFGIYDINLATNLNFKKRLDIYKQNGFLEVALYLDNKYLDKGENYLDIINYAKQINLKVKQVHLDYKNANDICNINSEIFKYLESKIKESEILNIQNVIIHPSSGYNPPIISQECLNKIYQISLNYPSVNLCFENVKNNTNLEKILNLNLQNIKMCYDLGHAHSYSNENELLNKFHSKIACSHLHNNFGNDEHLILSEGEINYKPIVEKILKISTSNCLECYPPRSTILSDNSFIEFVKRCYNSIKIFS